MPFYEKVGKLVKQMGSRNESTTKTILRRADTIHQIVLLEDRTCDYGQMDYWTLCCVYNDYTDENGTDIFSLCPIRKFF